MSYEGLTEATYLDLLDQRGNQIKRLKSQVAANNDWETKLMAERDHWEEKATELASDIGKVLGFDVGEHSNMNCPVQTAIDGLFEMGAQIEEWQSK